MRFVTAKNSGVAADHGPARVDAGAARVGENERSISATPPPRAVELTFQTVRPPSRRGRGREVAVQALGARPGAEDAVEALERQLQQRHVDERSLSSRYVAHAAYGFASNGP